jgi:hypothetical protein
MLRKRALTVLMRNQPSASIRFASGGRHCLTFLVAIDGRSASKRHCFVVHLPPSPPSLCLFTTLRPFGGGTGLRQRNAVASWRALGDATRVRILVFNFDSDSDSYTSIPPPPPHLIVLAQSFSAQ